MSQLLTSKKDNRIDVQRRFMIAGAVLAYTSCVWVFQVLGQLHSTDSGLLLLLFVWGAGLGAMIAAKGPLQQRGVQASQVNFSQAVWLNAGIVIVACLVSSEARLWVLSAAAFGILYSSTLLPSRAVVRIAAVTWLCYVGGLVLFERSFADTTEIVLLVGFTLIMIGAVWAGFEVGRLRQAYLRSTRELKEAVRRDDLTGLYNRREFMEQAEHQKALAERGKLTFALCFVDLDHFKRVNDRFGHQRGDDVLVRFAAIASHTVRDVDFVARVGGEEFIILLSDVSDSGARLVADRIRRQTGRMQIDRRDPEFRVTVSLGIAQFQRGESIEELIGRADAALYRAKASGRDRIEFADTVAFVEAFPSQSVRQRKSQAGS